jgi:hypothetical protein
MIHKSAAVELLAVEKSGGAIRITTPSLDRDADRVLPMGARLEAYLRNPVVQWGHGYAEPWQTIGRTTDMSVSEAGIDALFELREPAHDADPQHIVRALWEQRFINTASIGFKPLAVAPNEAGGMDFTAWELFEWSLVPIPANRDAVRLAFDAYPAAAKAYTAKAGRVLSKANEAKLRQAYEAIGAVLEQLAQEADEGKALPVDELPNLGTPPTAEAPSADIDVTDLLTALRGLRNATTRMV